MQRIAAYLALIVPLSVVFFISSSANAEEEIKLIQSSILFFDMKGGGCKADIDEVSTEEFAIINYSELPKKIAEIRKNWTDYGYEIIPPKYYEKNTQIAAINGCESLSIHIKVR